MWYLVESLNEPLDILVDQFGRTVDEFHYECGESDSPNENTLPNEYGFRISHETTQVVPYSITDRYNSSNYHFWELMKL